MNYQHSNPQAKQTVTKTRETTEKRFPHPVGQVSPIFHFPYPLIIQQKPIGCSQNFLWFHRNPAFWTVLQMGLWDAFLTWLQRYKSLLLISFPFSFSPFIALSFPLDLVSHDFLGNFIIASYLQWLNILSSSSWVFDLVIFLLENHFRIWSFDFGS